jgi:hypothetical protein
MLGRPTRQRPALRTARTAAFRLCQMPLVHFILLPRGPRYCPLNWVRKSARPGFESCAWQALKTIIVHETLQANVLTRPAIPAALYPVFPARTSRWGHSTNALLKSFLLDFLEPGFDAFLHLCLLNGFHFSKHKIKPPVK